MAEKVFKVSGQRSRLQRDHICFSCSLYSSMVWRRDWLV